MTEQTDTPEQQVASTYVEPFWRCLPAIFKYPFKPHCLMIMGLYSALFWLGGVLFFPVGTLVFMLTLMAAYQFCYSVLSWTAGGNLEPPVHFYLLQHWNVFWQQFLLWFCLGLAIGAVNYNFGPALALLLGVLILAFLPMATIVLSIEKSVFSAINVVLLIEGIRRMGRPYWMMLLVLAGILFLSGTVQYLVAQFELSMLNVFLDHFIWLYSSIVMFHLMGYLIMQCHEALGMELSPQVLDRDHQLRPDQSNPVMIRLETLMAEGQHRQARVMLRESIRRHNDDPSLVATYRALCMETDTPQDWYGFAGLQVIRQQEAGAVKEALTLVTSCLSEQPDFQLPEGDVILPLARAAYERGEFRLAVRLSKDFGKRYPRHPDGVALHLLIATILFEHLGEEARARAIVEYLIKRAVSHPLADEIRALRSQMDSLSTPPQ